MVTGEGLVPRVVRLVVADPALSLRTCGCLHFLVLVALVFQMLSNGIHIARATHDVQSSANQHQLINFETSLEL
jgi:hypothetical protein